MEMLITVLTYALPVVLAITVHEAAHGYLAKLLGDKTAYQLGRVTLNPLKHIDPIGTVVVPLGLLLVSKISGAPPFIFGWAKAVPVNPNALRRPRRDMGWVAAAGPVSNFLMGLGWALLYRFSSDTPNLMADMAQAGIVINLSLMALNFLPIPPLDGSKVLMSLLPSDWAQRYARLEPYGFPVLILLMVTNVLLPLMLPLFNLGLYLINALVFFGS